MGVPPSATTHWYKPSSVCRRGLNVIVMLSPVKFSPSDAGTGRLFFNHVTEAGFWEPTHCREKDLPATGRAWEVGRTEMGSVQREHSKHRAWTLKDMMEFVSCTSYHFLIRKSGGRNITDSPMTVRFLVVVIVAWDIVFVASQVRGSILE